MSLPQFFLGRELGYGRGPRAVPQPSWGVLVLDEHVSAAGRQPPLMLPLPWPLAFAAPSCRRRSSSVLSPPLLLPCSAPLPQLSPATFPGGPLHFVREPCHYLDLGGIQASSLRSFGGFQL